MDLLEALGASAPSERQDDGWYTCADLCSALKLSDKTMRLRLKALNKDGRLEVGKVDRVTISGVVFPTPAYRLKEA